MSVIRDGFPFYCAHFPGGDPRRFEPDLDSATVEEVERWRAACTAADERRDLQAIDGAAVWWAEPGSAGIAHLTMFGPGTYWHEHDLLVEEDESR